MMRAGRRSNRLLVGAIIVLVHAAVVVIVLSRRDRVVVLPPVATMIVRSVPLPPAAPSPAPKLPDIATVIEQPTFDIATPQPAGSCSLVTEIAAAIGADPAAAAALAPIAVDPRHAMMLWDGRWRSPPAADPVARTVLAALHRAPIRCLDELQAGPRLLIVLVGGTGVTLAIGSGEWRWRDLQSFVE